MFRYVAFAWDEQSTASSNRAADLARRVLHGAPDLRLVFDVPGLQVFASPAEANSLRPLVLTGHRGVLLGTLFRKPTDNSPKAMLDDFGETESALALSSRGEHLINAYWGRYVAFLRNRESGAKLVLRAPSGELDCLMVDLKGVHIFFNTLACEPVLALLPTSINWDYIASDLCVNIYEARETGLNEVSQVVHGERIMLTRMDTRREIIWKPLSIAREATIDDLTSAAAALRDTTQACVTSCASAYKSVVELLSGGLDSSIILACLKQMPHRPRITALNYRTAYDFSTDERQLARLAANDADVELIEEEQDTDFMLMRDISVPRTVNPLNGIFGSTGQGLSRVARQTRAQACITGQGGDEVFFQSGARFTAQDFLQRVGWRPELLRIALRAAQMEGDTVWGILFKRISRRPQELMVTGLTHHSLVTTDAIQTVTEKKLFLHPWLLTGERTVPGKWWHTMILSMCMPNQLYDPRFGSPALENVAPLLSQPIMEVCLRIPTYILTSNGQDRALARRAFEEHVPKEIVTRRTKGVTYDMTKVILEKNMGYIRELLLDGSLVREGILDRTRLEHALSGRATKDGEHPTFILPYAAYEAWARSWTRPQRVAA